MKNSHFSTQLIRLGVLVILVMMIIILFTTASTPVPSDITATHGAAAFHIQLTALAELGDCLPMPCPTQ